jgi:hypothetical protein
VINESFLDNFYGSGFSNDVDPDKYIQNENRVLGLARLRQVRVMSNSCVIPDDFKEEIKQCYSDWAPIVEEKQPYGPYVTHNLTNTTA